MALDHGMLNLPLAKRGAGIDAQIDRHKAEQAKQARATRREREAQRKAAKIEATQLLAYATEERIYHLAQRCSVTASAMRARLRSDCHWQPDLVIGLLK